MTMQRERGEECEGAERKPAVVSEVVETLHSKPSVTGVCELGGEQE